MLEQTWLYENFRLLCWTQNLCCSEHIALQCMAVSCGAQCISILSTSYALHIMMHFDNCYRSHDGVVLLNFLFLTVFHHYRKICVNWLSHYGDHCRLVTIRLSILFYLRTCFLNLQFLNVGEVVCFSLFLVIVFVCVLCVHKPRACHWRQNKINK